ncbi:hypothetical protein JYU34_006630 [Plutella xylostella]|uniref:Uncharacterized protein n=1 Tax=Plutella xylostella TaxID=51655 RepID=A0ABQ7QSN0_PLUXY|nr:uncharacterized protein LOC119691110 [Plutella xylostella]KAG7308001.1 hypothetical protein JYU34_006630 [Plutella xylostella]
MRRKLCKSKSLLCDDDMEELNVAALSQRKSRKESAAHLTERDDVIFFHGYPLVLMLRLRVLQIVCGIAAMVMGTVAFIEERQKLNMGLGIPAGGISVIAAAISIHTMRGLGPVTSGAGVRAAAACAWLAAACFLLTLIVQCCKTIVDPTGPTEEEELEEDLRPSPRDLIIIASIQIVLSAATLVSAAFCFRIDFWTRSQA